MNKNKWVIINSKLLLNGNSEMGDIIRNGYKKYYTILIYMEQWCIVDKDLTAAVVDTKTLPIPPTPIPRPVRKPPPKPKKPVQQPVVKQPK